MAEQSVPPLVEVTDLEKHFPVRGGVFGRTVGQVRAVDGVSFRVEKGRSLGLVGESGSGKTTVGRSILGLSPKTAGTVRFDGQDLDTLDRRELRALRPRLQLVFQDPYGALNPRLKVGDAIGEALVNHGLVTPEDLRPRVEEALVTSGLSHDHYDRYPHEFSGGQRQRIGIARAMVLNPDFVVADEPVSALDVSIQAQIINLFSDLQESRGVSYLFISHDLAVVEHLCQDIAVLYLGLVAEKAPRDELFLRSLHPYTQALLAAVPVINPGVRKPRAVLGGDIPNPAAPPSGCRFHPRCPLATPRCAAEVPELRTVGPDHEVACHLV